MFFEDLSYKDKEIPQTILGYGPFMAELYYGHRSRLYLDDLYNNPQNIADVIIESYDKGVRAINLVNDSRLLEAYDLACDAGCEMKVVATIGKSDVDYLNPNYEVAKEVDWDEDIELFAQYDCPLMLVDEFITDPVGKQLPQGAFAGSVQPAYQYAHKTSQKFSPFLPGHCFFILL